jgi:hypothetical protein
MVNPSMTQQTTGASFEPAEPLLAPRAQENRLLGEQTVAYSLIILVAIVGAYLYAIRTTSILSCPASGYSADQYLAYCHAAHYGDYDHGAFWFGLEPKIRETAQAAEVLFLGSSRMEFAFSSDVTNHWFSTRATSYYLMGFAYYENYLFESELLRQLKPRARVYVVNIDTFFENTVTPPAQAVMHDSDALSRYQTKRNWQRVHAWICSLVASACGSDQAFFRSRSTGGYVVEGGRMGKYPVSYDDSVDQKMAQDYTLRAREFLAGLPVDANCVVFTMVPMMHTPMGTAQAIAHSLGTELIAPRLDDLNTFDTSHMDRASAELWARAFFAAAGPRIRQCLGNAGT